MKLDLVKSVAQEVRNDLGKDKVTCDLYYFYDGSWFELSTSSVVDKNTSETLNNSKLQEVSFQNRASKEVWFYFSNLSIVVKASFTSSPKLEKRKMFRLKISESIKHATNEYKVTYNQLTQLLAKDAFNAVVANEISQSQNAKASASEGQQNSISILAFDIDKFKQVNDTNSHQYGDQVLKAFAYRLEDVESELKIKYGNSIRTALGHVSGDEFFALIVGDFTRIEICNIADKFRQKIAIKTLPDDDEWLLLSKQAGINNIKKPPVHERVVKTSIGIATYSDSMLHLSFSAQDETVALLDRADAALIRSKCSRDSVTHFDEILQNYGRILEFDIDTGVAAIDIGIKLGVALGQEFRVYSPVFSGKKPFTVGDERSKRTLGVYPRVEICRLIVFDVQNDICFAEMIQKKSSAKLKLIPVGAVLEAIPLGSISHLLDHSGMLGNSVLGIGLTNVLSGADLHQKLNETIKQKLHPFVVVFKFKNEQSYIKDYGSASLNRALAKLYSGVNELLPSSVSIGLIDGTSVCAVGDYLVFKDKLKDMELLFTENFPADDELLVTCGYYKPDSGLSEKNGIEFARYAASGINENSNDRIVTFSVKIAESMVAQHRTARTFKAGIADYLRLTELGVSSAALENLAGLCYSQLGENISAFECYKRAMESEPKNSVFIGNYGLLAERIGNIEEGLKAFSTLTSTVINTLDNKQPHAYIAYASLLAQAKLNKSAGFNSDMFNKISAKAINLKEAANWEVKIKEIKIAMNDV